MFPKGHPIGDGVTGSEGPVKRVGKGTGEGV